MTNAQKTEAFFAAIDDKTKMEILAAIASRYGVTLKEAREEVTHPEAENLCDYLTGNIRLATDLLMKKVLWETCAATLKSCLLTSTGL